MTNKNSIFFILGAGASVDSGLPTYRGENGIYEKSVSKPEKILSPKTINDNPQIVWDFLENLYNKIKQCSPGPTYSKLSEISKKYPDSFILTQNIDGYAKTVNVPVVEMHGNYSTAYCMSCRKINDIIDLSQQRLKQSNSDDLLPDEFISNNDISEKIIFPNQMKCPCGGWYRPNVVLFEENLPKREVDFTYKLLRMRPKYVVIIGTSMQFPYLRVFINKAKSKGSKVIHINPDTQYASEVKKNEIWIKKLASEGLDDFLLNY